MVTRQPTRRTNMLNYTLLFQIKSDWFIGSGKEAGAYADALCLKNNSGLPYIPGKSCKGLLKDAFKLAAHNNWFEPQLVKLLFGEEGEHGNHSQGLLQISSAGLSDAESQFIIDKQASKHLFRVLQSTAIDSKTGSAKTLSLRSVEVAIPMDLRASLSLNINHPNYSQANSQFNLDTHFQTYLQQVLTLIHEFGGKRHRGFGQVTVSIEGA